MKKTILILISFLIVQSSIAGSFTELQVVPHDTTNANLMKIWFPVKAAFCQVKLKILDKKMKHVRTLLNQKIKHGYYNIFWDKKDDSGNYVPEGLYKIATVSCDYKRIEPLKVRYTDGENVAKIQTSNDNKKPYISLTLQKDSVVVSLEIVNSKMNPTAELFTDSLITSRSVVFDWVPESIIPTGRYFYKLKVNEFEHLIPFRYKK